LRRGRGASLVPLVVSILSQFGPPESVEVDAVQFSTPVPIFTTPNFCGGTTPPWATAVKLMPV